MKLSIKSISNVGAVRKANEDYLFDGARFIRDDKHEYELDVVAEDTKILFAVADGMGGHNAGELASEILLKELVNSFSIFVREYPDADSADLKVFFSDEIKRIHQYLVDEGKRNPEKSGMGSTFVGLLLYKGRFFAINAGDSRLYRFRDGILKQMTKDHSYAAMFGQDRAASHIIYNAVGGGETVFNDFVEITTKIDSGDLLILCSDGLSDMLTDDDIELGLNMGKRYYELMEFAYNEGGRDNISIISIELIMD